MKWNVGYTKLANKFVAIALSLLLCQPTFAGTPSTSENNQMAFEGSLTDTSGNPISLAGVSLNFYISANGCYLYGESSSTAGDSQGNINHRFGSGTVAPGSPNTFSQNLFFGNVTGTTNFAGNSCSVTANDTRLAQVYYQAQNITATIKLGTVPYAANATMFDGKVSTDFVQVSADTNTVFSGGSAGQYLTKSATGLAWTTNTLTAAQVQTALGYTPASATNTALTATDVTAALGYTPANSATLTNYALRGNNLSDLTSATAARTNLGLGSLAVKNSVDLATVDVTGMLPASRLPSFSGDVSTGTGSSVTTVQAIRGVQISATAPVSGQILYFNGSAWTPTTVPNNVGTVTSVTSTNSDIAITFSTTTPTLTLNVGTGPNQIIRTDATARLPSVDASNLINLNAAQLTGGTIPTPRLPAFAGDVTTVAGSNTTTVAKLRGIDIASGTPTTGQVLTFNAGKWAPATPTTGTVGQVTAGSGLLGGTITSAGTLSVNFGTASGTVAQGNDSRITGALQAANNLSDLTSATTARTNLGLGSLATKSVVDLTTDVTGILPVANGGSPWQTNSFGPMTTSNTTIGTTTGYANIALTVNAPSATANSSIGYFNNTAGDGNGLKVNVDNTMSTKYGLKVTTTNSTVTNFVVLNNGNVGVGLTSATARLHIGGGSSATAGLKISSGTLLTAPQAGSIEYDGAYLYHTDDTGFRRVITMGNSNSSIDNITSINTTSNFTISTPSALIVSSAANSSNYQSGAFIVKGGIGVNGNGNFNGAVNASGNISTSGTLNAIGAINTNSGINAAGNISTTASLFVSGNITTSGSINTTNNIFGGALISQYLYGGITSGATLTIDSTSHANKGNIVLANGGGNVGVGIVNPTYRFQVKSPAANSYGQVFSPSTGSGMIINGEDGSNQLYNLAYDTAGQPRWFFTVSGTNYINNDVSIGNTLALPNSRLSVHGNLSVNGNATVSKTLILSNTSSSVPIQFVNSTLTSTSVSNSIEYDGTHVFFTNAQSVRRRLAGGIVSGTIDNVNKFSYGGGNLLLEGNNTGSNPAVTVNNAGAGTVALQTNGQVTVSGSIKLAGDGSDVTNGCTTTDEGKQRYNKTYKTMEYCDGANWQGVTGVTYCDAGWMLIGVAGTPSAFCIESNANTVNTYSAASLNCKGKGVARRSKPMVCNVPQLDSVCESNAITGINNVTHWTSHPASGNQQYNVNYQWNTGACHVQYNSGSDWGRALDILPITNTYAYRCCYQ